jgi:hypothetical protein
MAVYSSTQKKKARRASLFSLTVHGQAFDERCKRDQHVQRAANARAFTPALNSEALRAFYFQKINRIRMPRAK